MQDSKPYMYGQIYFETNKADNYIAYLLKFLHFSFWRGEENSQVTTFISKARRLSENPTDKLCARRLLQLLRH